MTYIIFANDKDKGYCFTQKSEDFPAAYESAVQKVCDSVADPRSGVEERAAFRYTPLNDRFLLSVIFRRPFGDWEQRRGYNAVVNLLLSAAEADELFALPTDRVLHRMERYAEKLLNGQPMQEGKAATQKTAETNAANWDAQPRTLGKLPSAALLAGAAYSDTMESSSPKQLYISLDSDPLQELNTLMCRLPRQLRKQVRFHTAIIAAQESRGIALNFAAPEMLRDIIAKKYDRGENSDKFVLSGEDTAWLTSADVAAAEACSLGLTGIPCAAFLYPLLMASIDSWEGWRALGKLTTSRRPLDRALALLPEERILEELRRPGVSRETLTELRDCGNLTVAACARKELLTEKEEAISRTSVSTTEEAPAAAIPTVKPRRSSAERGAGKAAVRAAAVLGRVLILAVLVALWAVTLLGFFRADVSAGETTIVITVSAAQAANFVRLLLSLTLTGVISALIGSWVTDRKWRKRAQKEEKPIEKQENSDK